MLTRIYATYKINLYQFVIHSHSYRLIATERRNVPDVAMLTKVNEKQKIEMPDLHIKGKCTQTHIDICTHTR